VIGKVELHRRGARTFLCRLLKKRMMFAQGLGRLIINFLLYFRRQLVSIMRNRGRKNMGLT
jgi:hypothetical protein